MLRLFQSYGVSTGMYGCQVWGSRFARIDRVFKSDIARRHMCFLRRTAGVARSTPNWALLTELNCRPYHYYWIRALLKFHKSLLNCNSPLLQDVVEADAWLATQQHVVGSNVRKCDGCWSAELAAGLCSIGEAAGEAQKGASWESAVRTAAPVDAPSVMLCLQAAYDRKAWHGCDQIHDIRVADLQAADGTPVGRKHATYHAWFKLRQPGMPPFMWSPVTKHNLVKNMLRFRLGSHYLGCNLGRQLNPPVPWAERSCSRCSDGHLASLSCAVDDEFHAIFECEAFAAARDASSVSGLITCAAGDVRTFMCSDAVGSVMKYISAIMDMLDGAFEGVPDGPHADQSSSG